MRVFTDILVMPTQGLRNGVGGPGKRGLSGFVRGGPVWPRFALQIGPRHCRGFLPFPIDRKPVPMDGPVRTASRGVWCGPVSPHFGHMIDDFISRVPRSIDEADGMPLVFSLGPDVGLEPGSFFWQVLDQLGANRNDVLLVREPTRFGTLRVFPQEERVGAGPRARYLDLLDRMTRRSSARTAPIDTLFVSKALVHDGKLIGERYLDTVFAKAGAVVIHPETMTLAEQLDHYRRARTIVFSEGSALHGLQLLGRLDARVVVLVRREGCTLARHALRPRVTELRYWNCLTGLIYGCHTHGRPQLDRALAVFDTADLMRRLEGIGIDLAPHWDDAAYAQAKRADALSFARYMKQAALHPQALAMIQDCLDRNRIDLDVRAALETAQ